MKRFFTVAALVVFSALWTTMSARWVVGERKSASQIKAGDTVVISYASSEAYSDYYIQAADDDHAALGVMVAQGMGLGASAVITFENGPADLRTGAPTFYMKLVETGKYIGNKYYDWYNVGQGAVDIIDNAGNFQILSCGEDIPWYNEEKASYTKWSRNDDAVWDDKSVAFSASPSESDYCYLAYWSYASSSPRAITWKYTSTIQWNVYSVSYEKDYREELENLIDLYSTASADFVAGTDPGFYDANVIETYNQVLEQAMLVCYTSSSTDSELEEAYNNLRTAYKNMAGSLIPVSEGYYYIMNDNEKIAANGKTEKAMYVNETARQMYWGEFDANDLKFVFYISPNDASTWLVQNMKTGLYFGAPGGFCKPFAASADKDYPATFKFYNGTGSCYIKTGGWTMCPYGNAGGTADGPNYVWCYNGETTSGGNVAHAEWTWALRRITDQSVIDRFAEEKAQYDRTNVLKSLSEEASSLYDKLFTYRTDTDNGLITDADAQVKYSRVIQQGVSFSDKYPFLIDGFDTTYVQGRGYVDIAITAAPQQKVTFFYKRRGASVQYPKSAEWGESERPDRVNIYAANDTANGGDWTFVKEIRMGDLAEPIMVSVDLGAEYKFLRYDVQTNKTGGNVFTMSEFQVYPCAIDESASQYYTAQGMKTAADALLENIDAMRSVIEANTATADNIASMRASIGAVRTLYADTTVLSALIAECEGLADNVTVGTAIGQIDDEAQIAALRTAIATAKTDGFKDNISKADLDAVIAALTAVRTEFLSHVKNFETGKWYFITNGDTADGNTNGGKALYMTGYSNESEVGVGKLNEDGSAAYTYDPYCMWTFVPAADGTFNIQNMGTGFYLADYVKSGENAKQSYTGVPYKVSFLGADSYAFIPQGEANTFSYGLTAGEDKAGFAKGVAGTASSWQITEIDPESTEMITVKDFKYNMLDIVVFPFNIEDFSLNGDDAHLYGIRKITQSADGTSTIELYEKTSAKAGESCLLVLGDPEAESEDFELLFPFPTSVTDKAIPDNGIYGMLNPQAIGEGDVYSSADKLVAATGTVNISAHTGAIVPSYYTGEVSGVETALTLTVKGMGAIPSGNTKGDVNGDGSVNTADIVMVYNYIQAGDQSGVSQSAADVSGDGTVNSADVVEIYNVIVGGGTASKAYQAQIRRLLAE